MNEQTEKRQYNNATLAEREYYAKPRWHEVAISEKSGNLILTVLWDVCDKDGHAGAFDIETGAETPLPDGADGWEAISQTYVIAYADEAATLAKCKGKDIEYLKDLCPRTYKQMKRILEWCPEWDPKRVMWFTDCRETFYSNVVRVTCVHEEWNGQLRAKAKWTNAKERKAREPDTTETRASIRTKFGGFFDVAASAPAPRAKAEKPAPMPPAAPATSAPPAEANKSDCWSAFCRKFGSSSTDRWFEMVAAIGKAERDFTPADWAALLHEIDVNPPF